MIDLFKNDREFDDNIIKQKNMVVVQHNDLITKAKYDLSTNEIKVMDYIISKIKPEDKNFEIIRSSLDEISEILGLTRSGRTYNQLTRTLRNLRQKEVIIYNKNTKVAIVTGWLKEFEVSNSGQIEAEISTKLAPYLLELKNKGNYTQHILQDTIQLDSKYSIRLYKLMRERDKNRGKDVPIIIDTPKGLKEKLSAPKSYNWSQLKQNVIDRAIEEINLKIRDMNLELKTVKNGRKIVQLKIKNTFYPIKIRRGILDDKSSFFDINETILDLKVINKKFDKYFESQHVGEYWFSKLLHTSNIMSIMNEYVDFNKLAEIVLENIFYENDKEITKDIKSEILGTFKTLPIYPDVRESLEILKENGIKIIALSNSSLEMMKIQLQSENIKKIFDNYYSVDSVKKYKPYSDIYEYVADQENLSFEEIIMVASHDWDLFGAKKVGMRTAYINRKKERFNPTYPNPDISERNLVSLAKKIINIK